MKASLTLIAFLLFFSIGLHAQNTSKKNKIYKVWITMLDDSKVQGVLYSADNEFIKISKNNSFDFSNLTTINFQNIDVIKIRRKGKIGKGAWIGAASGVGFGVILGLASENDGWEGLVATGAGFFFGVIGTGVGAGVGTIKKKIHINGNIEIYKSHLEEIKSYSFTPNNTSN